MEAHSERYDVVTSFNGESQLHFHLACATALEHYHQTTATTVRDGAAAEEAPVKAADAPICATGLRVYDGAQVLASFLAQLGLAVAPMSRSSTPPHDGPCTPSGENEVPERCTDSKTKRYVLELGCGCGLVGFTASTILGQRSTAGRDGGDNGVRVVFTDASEQCLRLVERTGDMNGMPVTNGKAFVAEWRSANEEEVGCDSTAATRRSPDDRITFPLMWSPEGVAALQHDLRTCAQAAGGPSSPPRIGLVLGSDILYYRVDIHALLCTIKDLLGTGGSTNPSMERDAEAMDGLCVLCHFMRIARGRERLAKEARALGMGIAEVPLSAFLARETVVWERSWGGVEVAVLYLREPREDEHKEEAARHTSTNAAETSAPAEELLDPVETEAQKAAADVAGLRLRLRDRIARWQAEAERGDKGSALTAIAQAERLMEAVSPYIYHNAEADALLTNGRRTQETAEDEFLHLLL